MRDSERTLRLILLTLGVIALSLYLLAQFAELFARVADVALVFIFAWALAYLLAPPVAWLDDRTRLNRVGAVFVVYVALVIGLVAALAIAVPAIAAQLASLAQSAPAFGDALAERVRALQADLELRGVQVDLEALYGALPERLAAAAAAVASDALSVLGGIFTLLLNITLVAVVSFFMLVDGDRLWRDFVRVLPADLTSEAELLRMSADRSFGGFLRGQLLLGLAYGLIIWIVLAGLGVQFALLLAIASGLLMIIPFFGAIIATAPPVLVALTQGVQLAVVTLFAILIVQNVMLNVVGPRLMAQTVGVHPLVVFAALLIGARVGGLWGVFLALPIAGILNILTQYVTELAQGRRTRGEAAQMLKSKRRGDHAAS
jgi:predicted PurR-regulated permease PerM